MFTTQWLSRGIIDMLRKLKLNILRSLMDTSKASIITILKTEKAPKAIGPYSQGTKVGNMVYTSGQIGMDLEGNLVGSDV